mmetsp:Transcript_12221/g.16930  ORF Transcript_12221/g.16930 Transcript_12221/m.16930 type:complete len:357 (+) Transcript_12221:90-1160(+)
MERLDSKRAVKKQFLTSKVLGSFEPAAKYSFEGSVNSIDYSDDGDFLVASADDDSVCLYDCHTAQLKAKVFCKRNGASVARFTHHSKAILCASRDAKGPNGSFSHNVHYLSLHDNRYLRSFKGHKKEVTQIAMHPSNDTFMTGGQDRTVRMWDLRDHKPHGLLEANDAPAISYDPQGLIMAISVSHNQMSLYDCRTYKKGPFATLLLKTEGPHSQLKYIKFTPDSNYFLASFTSGPHMLFDAFEGERKAVYKSDGLGQDSVAFEPSISPDGQYLISGTTKGLRAWEVTTGSLLQTSSWDKSSSSSGGRSSSKSSTSSSSSAVGTVSTLACWNPRTLMFASSVDRKLLFWLPKILPK